MKTFYLFITYLFVLTAPVKLTSAVVIQVDIDSSMNARPVTTLTWGKLAPWTKGVDGNGSADGYFTQSAADFIGDKGANALPDNPTILANNSHPEIMLHYNNADSTKNQARYISGAGEFNFKTPQKKYSDMYLALTSAEGASALAIQLIYADGISDRNVLLPDYYQDLPANDPDFCYLVHDLAKWGTKNDMREKDHHNIDLLRIPTDPKRQLTAIKIKKGQAGYLLFWAATGVVAD